MAAPVGSVVRASASLLVGVAALIFDERTHFAWIGVAASAAFFVPFGGALASPAVGMADPHLQQCGLPTHWKRVWLGDLYVPERPYQPEIERSEKMYTPFAGPVRVPSMKARSFLLVAHLPSCDLGT